MTFLDESATHMERGKVYRFQVEVLADVLGSMTEILERNHKEMSSYDLPFEPDYRRYLYIESVGSLSFMTIRDEENVIGYSIFFIDDSIQQKGVMAATQSVLYIDKEHRGIGLAFMRFCDDTFKKMGVNSIWRQAHVKHDISSVYLRMGYGLVEKAFLKRL